MTYSAYRLRTPPAHMHIPRECEPHVARLLRGGGEPGGELWPLGAKPEDVIRGLEWHAIGPVLYHRARQQGILAALPQWLRTYLHASYHQCAALNLAREAPLLTLVDALHVAETPVVLLKGAALARSVYPHVGLRPMVDVDLLVPPSALDGACDVLRRQGYRQAAQDKVADHDHHLRFHKSEQGVLLELHWRLSDKTALASCLPVKDLLARTRSAPAPFADALVLDPCDTVLHVTLHMADHDGLIHFGRLSDLHLLVGKLGSPADWESLAARAVEANLQLVLAAALQEASAWLGTAVPEEFWQRLNAAVPPPAAALAAFACCGVPEQWQVQVHELRARPTLAGRLHYAKTVLFPPARFLRQRDRVRSAWSLPLCYVRRLARGARAIAAALSRAAYGRLIGTLTGSQKDRDTPEKPLEKSVAGH